MRYIQAASQLDGERGSLLKESAAVVSASRTAPQTQGRMARKTEVARQSVSSTTTGYGAQMTGTTLLHLSEKAHRISPTAYIQFFQ